MKVSNQFSPKKKKLVIVANTPSTWNNTPIGSPELTLIFHRSKTNSKFRYFWSGSVSHVHIHASIIFTSIITNSDSFWTLLVRYFTLHMQLSSTDSKISFDSTKRMSHFLPYLFTSSKKLFCACLTILVSIIQLILFTLPFSFFFFLNHLYTLPYSFEELHIYLILVYIGSIYWR